jgi:crotonobetainyl-CoA:carnitine CoA-transferase CaiB-like acyl-CoA transferase
MSAETVFRMPAEFTRTSTVPCSSSIALAAVSTAARLARVMAAAWHAQRTGHGQVVDTAMVETSAHLMTNFFGLAAADRWKSERGSNILDSGAFFYDVFECKEGGHS